MTSGLESAKAIDPAEWYQAGKETAGLIDGVSVTKRYLVAKKLDWHASKLSRILNGKQLPTIREVGQLETFLLTHSTGYDSGTVEDIWYSRVDVVPPNARTVDLSVTDRRLASADQPTRRRKGLILSIAAVLSATAVGIGLLTAGNESADEVVFSGTCVFQPGETTPGNTERLAAYVAAFEERFAASGGAEVVGCPTSTMELWQDLVVQTLSFADRPAGTLVAANSDTVLMMPWTAWISYRQIGGKSGDNAQELAGLPISISQEGQLTVITLDTGGYLVAEDPDAPYFWAPELAVARIDEFGGLAGALGRPTGYPLVRDGFFLQDFLNGTATLAPDGTMSVQIVDDAAGDLADYGSMAGKILRQTDGTAWYVTESRSRQWIPDGTVWECLGGWDNVAANDVSGWAIASLPYGGHASCP